MALQIPLSVPMNMGREPLVLRRSLGPEAGSETTSGRLVSALELYGSARPLFYRSAPEFNLDPVTVNPI